jgi:hypothetical protein
MMRDPRDVVVSRHRQHPEVYWANLGQWNRVHREIRGLAGHPRFMLVRYEDLVAEPDAVQDRIAAGLPATERRARFSDFARVAAPAPGAERALGGVRAIGGASIGAWRAAPARVLGQMRLHGDPGPALREFGYETDEAWRAALEGIEPDTAPGYWPDRPRRSLRRKLKRWRGLAGYARRSTAARIRSAPR